MTPTQRWIDRARSQSTGARVIQTLIDAGEDPETARRLVLQAARDHSKKETA